MNAAKKACPLMVKNDLSWFRQDTSWRKTTTHGDNEPPPSRQKQGFSKASSSDLKVIRRRQGTAVDGENSHDHSKQEKSDTRHANVPGRRLMRNGYSIQFIQIPLKLHLREHGPGCI